MGPTSETHSLNARLLRFRSHPDQEDARSLAHDLLEAKRYGDARGVVLAAQGEDGADGELLVIEGRAWYAERDLVRAQAALLKAAKVDPRSADAFRWLGEVLLKRGDPPRAARALNRALDLRPEYNEAQELARRAEQLARVAASVPAAPAAPEPPAAPPPPPAAASGAPLAPPPPAAGAASPAPTVIARPPRPVKPPTSAGQPSPFPPPAAPSPVELSAPVSRREAAEEEPTGSFHTSSSGETSAPVFEDLSDGGLDEPWDPSVAGQLRAPTTASGGLPAPPISAPGSSSSPGHLSSPGRSAPGSLSAPGVSSSPGRLSSPGTTSAAGRSAPGSLSAPGVSSSPGRLSSPGTTSAAGRSAPGSLSTPGVGSSPGRLSSPGTTSAAGRSAPGSLSAPGVGSSPGRLSSPGTTSAAGRSAPGISSPGQRSAPGSVSSPGVIPYQTPSTAAGDLEAEDYEVEVESAVIPGDTTPGVGEPAPDDWRPPSNPAWDESSPALDFSFSTAGTESAVGAESAEYPEPPDGELAAPEPDLPLGDDSGHGDDPDNVLESLRVQGIFEPPEEGEGEDLAAGGAPEEAVWAAPQEVARGGTRLRGALIGVWALTLVLFGGGYYGWHQWVGKRHREAAELVVQARAAAFDSDYAKLVDAERLLRLAREKHARSTDIPRYELFVQTQRVLENGSRELSGLRSSLVRAERLGADARYLGAGRAVLAAFSGGGEEATKLREAATKSASGDGELLYVAGRLEQRLGLPGAAGHLEAAVAAAPELRAATLALGELAHDGGSRLDALARFDAVLKKQADHLRAGLWRAFLTADEQELDAGLAALDGLRTRATAAAPIDRVLWSLSRARLLTRKGELESAGKAVAEALSSGTNEPRLLAMVAEEARRTGQLSLAQTSATRAVAAAPSSLAYRVLLARVMIERGDGARAMDLLAKLPAEDPGVLMMRARAALQSGEREALESGLAALEGYPEEGEAKLAVRALSLRLQARLQPTMALLRKARRLVKRAPGDPDAARALGEVALELREPRDATRALEQLVAAAPDDAEGHYLLARARRMASDGAGAEQAYRRALELSPGHRDAMVGLGGLLLDSGKYAEADALYQKLVSAGTGTLFGRLGRVEALLGLGRLDDAQVQLAGLPEKLRDGRAARETGARLALARRKPGEALTLLRPLAQAEGVKPATLALYGEALYAADQVNAAAQSYERALQADGTLPEALIGRAQVHLRAERPGDALGLLEEAQDVLETRLRGPDVHGRMLTFFGHAYVQRGKAGDLDRARRVLLEAIDLPGITPEAHFWLGEASGGRRTPEAAAAFKRYLELEPKGRYAERARRALGPML